jgi:hypothetical protein
MSQPRHNYTDAHARRRWPELCDTAAPACTPHPYTIPPSAYVFGGGGFCEPGKCYAEDRVWTWRERALRAAAVAPCTKRGQLVIHAYGPARYEYPPADGPRCALYVQHLHPAVQAAWTGRCVP